MVGGFRRDIQGLRALAVLAVMICHTFPARLPGGFVGVDIFFVISGYLISALLMRDLDEGRFSILGFYRRRLRRILPALSVVVAATAIAGFFLSSPDAFAELGATVAATMLFVSNFEFWRLGDYFGAAAETRPLLHMWSLAVEEQFYILFPPLLWLIWPRFGRRQSALLLSALALASLVVAEVELRRDPAAAYYLPASRALELLIGAIVASGALPRIGAGARAAAVGLGLALMSAAMAFYGPQTPFPGLAALAPCLGAALVIHAGEGGASAPARALGWRPMRFVGDISYSLYLWHWPILAYLRAAVGIELTPLQGVAAMAASFVVATLGYYGVERPFLVGGARRAPALSLGLSAIAALAAIGVAIDLGDGFPGRFEARARALLAAADDYNHERPRCHFDGQGEPKLYAETCVFGAEGVAPDLAVWGDSHGAELALVLGERARTEGRSVRAITASACPPALDFALPIRPRCPEENRVMLAGLVADARIQTVVLAANGDRYPDVGRLEAGMAAAAQTLRAAGKRLVLFKQIPIMGFAPPARLAEVAEQNGDLAAVGLDASAFAARSARYNAFIERLAAQNSGILVNPADSLCDAALCHVWRRKTGVLYIDHEHLGLTGVRATFAPLIERLYGGRSEGLPGGSP